MGGVEPGDHRLHVAGQRWGDAPRWGEAGVVAYPGEHVEHAGIPGRGKMAGGAVVHRDRGQVPGDRAGREPVALAHLAGDHGLGWVVGLVGPPGRGQVGDIQRHGQRVGRQGVAVQVERPEPEPGPVLGVAAFGGGGPGPPGMPAGHGGEPGQHRRPRRDRAVAVLPGPRQLGPLPRTRRYGVLGHQRASVCSPTLLVTTS